ncbi:MAG TPA: glycosyltransferase [Candidatus Saccharimonadales bacterium]|nr:glycosyltransferase [Candidatus Saccharimonadales bacterium]
MPIYEDWDSAIALCKKIDDIFRNENSFDISLLLIDDGSSVSIPPDDLKFLPQSIKNISVLILRRNLGHQRAIAVGLAYLHRHMNGDAVVVMDADGEDRPQDIPVLIERMRQMECPAAVFAERGKRLENAMFRFFYQCFRILHKIFTGRDIRFGNFSVMPWKYLDSLVAYPELWNHYAATFIKSRLPYVRVRLDRANRIAGESRMDFVSLVIHGLSALFANQEVVGTRLLVLNIFMTLGLFVLVGVVMIIKLFTQLAIPGWATTTMGLLLILASQSLVACFLLVFSIMMNRSHLGFLPIRDHSHFVRCERTLYSQ